MKVCGRVGILHVVLLTETVKCLACLHIQEVLGLNLILETRYHC
jgi:hypothetical protein